MMDPSTFPFTKLPSLWKHPLAPLAMYCTDCILDDGQLFPQPFCVLHYSGDK